MLPSGERVLGIDPGLNTTGYGVVECTPRGPKLIEGGVVRGRTKGSLAARLREIHEGVIDLLRALKPHCMALEEIYSHYERPKTAILMGHARGVIVLAATLLDVPVFHYPSTTVKRITTGNGRAPKPQIQEAVQRELNLKALPTPHDVADALAIALCHYHLAGQGVASSGEREAKSGKKTPPARWGGNPS